MLLIFIFCEFYLFHKKLSNHKSQSWIIFKFFTNLNVKNRFLTWIFLVEIISVLHVYFCMLIMSPWIKWDMKKNFCKRRMLSWGKFIKVQVGASFKFFIDNFYIAWILLLILHLLLLHSFWCFLKIAHIISKVSRVIYIYIQGKILSISSKTLSHKVIQHVLGRK